MSEPVRMFGSPFSWAPGHGLASRVVLSVGMAGLLALAATVSFPVPWTPVPFSMAPLALLVVGGYQRPVWAALSVGIYLLAGALGAPVLAGGAAGWEHFLGPTAGYLFGYVLAASIVAAYLGRPRRTLPPAAAWTALGLLGGGVVAGIAAIAYMLHTEQGLAALSASATWGVTESVVWALVYVTAASIVGTVWLLRRGKPGAQALDLYIVMLAAILVLHACGVVVLWSLTGLHLMAAVILGSIVFLPFDAVKAGLAVGLTLPFLPTPENEDHA